MANMRDISQWLRQPVTGLAHPEVADGGDGVQMLGNCAVLSQQSGRAGKRLSLHLGGWTVG
jgi:hypothetical protein